MFAVLGFWAVLALQSTRSIVLVLCGKCGAPVIEFLISLTGGVAESSCAKS